MIYVFIACYPINCILSTCGVSKYCPRQCTLFCYPKLTLVLFSRRFCVYRFIKIKAVERIYTQNDIWSCKRKIRNRNSCRLVGAPHSPSQRTWCITAVIMFYQHNSVRILWRNCKRWNATQPRKCVINCLAGVLTSKLFEKCFCSIQYGCWSHQ